MIYSTFIFTCNGCEERNEYESKQEAHKCGWGIADDKNTCLCPKCMARERLKKHFKVKFK